MRSGLNRRDSLRGFANAPVAEGGKPRCNQGAGRYTAALSTPAGRLTHFGALGRVSNRAPIRDRRVTWRHRPRFVLWVNKRKIFVRACVKSSSFCREARARAHACLSSSPSSVHPGARGRGSSGGSRARGGERGKASRFTTAEAEANLEGA